MFKKSLKNTVVSKIAALFVIAVIILPNGLMVSPTVAHAEESTVSESSSTPEASAPVEVSEVSSAPETSTEVSTEVTSEVTPSESTPSTTDETAAVTTPTTEETTTPAEDTVPPTEDTTDTAGGTSGSAPELVGAPVIGSLTVCNLIVDENDNVVSTITSVLPASRFAIDVTGPEGSIATAKFDTMELAVNSQVLTASSENDAQCVTYPNLPANGDSYHYNQETIVGPSTNAWQTAKYDDLVGVHTTTSLDSFYVFDNGNVDSDGHVVLTPETPNRTVAVLNKYVPLTTGSITVCKLIVDQDNNVMTGEGLPAGEFSVSVRHVVGDEIGNASFSTNSFNPNTQILTDGSGDDSQCVTYSDLPFDEAGYYYSQETISGNETNSWSVPKYDDNAVVHVVTTLDGSFYPFSGELFDNDPANDDDRNVDSDGHIILTAVRPNRTVVVLNQFGVSTEPCVEGVLTPAGFTAARESGNISFFFDAVETGSTTATFHVTNNTGCTAPISLTSYKIFDNEMENWQLFDNSGVVNVGAESTAILNVDLPDCMSMIYAWYGQGVSNFTVDQQQGYYSDTTRNPHIFDKARHYNTGPFCEQSGNSAPVITLNGNNPMTITVGDNFTDPGATANDAEEGDITSRITASSTVDASTVGTYTIVYRVSDTPGLTDEETRTVIVEQARSGGGGGSSGGSRRRSSGGVGGSVLGEEVGPLACPYLNDYLRRDWNNNPTEVMKLQYFLKIYAGFNNLAVTGVFDQATFDAVSQFQTTYMSDVLSPWGHDKSTGYVYILTKKKINEIVCQTTFPLNALQENEISAFRALMSGTQAGVVGSGESNDSGSNTLDVSGLVGQVDDSSDNSGIAENFGDKVSAFPDNIQAIASAIWSLPKDRGMLLQSLYFLLIAIIAIYLATEIVVGSMNTADLNKYKIWARKALGYIIGLVLAIIVAVWYKVFSIVIPLIILLIVAGAFLASAMTKRNGDEVISLPPNQK